MSQEFFFKPTAASLHRAASQFAGFARTPDWHPGPWPARGKIQKEDVASKVGYHPEIPTVALPVALRPA